MKHRQRPSSPLVNREKFQLKSASPSCGIASCAPVSSGLTSVTTTVSSLSKIILTVVPWGIACKSRSTISCQDGLPTEHCQNASSPFHTVPWRTTRTAVIPSPGQAASSYKYSFGEDSLTDQQWPPSWVSTGLRPEYPCLLA